MLRAFWLRVAWGADKVVRVGSGRGRLGCAAAEVYACLDDTEFVFVVFFGQIKACLGYKRCNLKGKRQVKIDMGLVLMANNLLKYNKRRSQN